MSGSSAGNYVAETPAASNEDWALDEAGELAADQVAFTLSMLSLATPEQKKALDELVNDVRLLADRERAARYEAKLTRKEADRHRAATGAYQSRADRLEDELDRANGKIKRLESQVARLRAKAKKGGAS